MGVMDCVRKDCDNIMCSTYIKTIGLICDECKSEFKDYLLKEGLNLETRGEIRIELERFVGTSKDCSDDDDETSVDDFFDECKR